MEIICNALSIFRNIVFFNEALLGAVVGGYLALQGSLIISNREWKREKNTKISNTIYKPLYNELMKNHELLFKHPYPTFIQFRSSQQTLKPHPQYVVWDEIKLDDRFLEIDKALITHMERLYISIDAYFNDFRPLCLEVQNEINNFLEDTIGSRSSLQNLVEVYLNTIMEEQENWLYESIKHSIKGCDVLSVENFHELQVSLQNQIKNNSSLTKLKVNQKNWINNQQILIDMLKHRIKKTSKA